jgi:putative FmdB family regulatory protein
MPIFDYHCRACEQRFEVLQKADDPPPAACPACGGSAIDKCLSAPGFRLKGKGWRKAEAPAPKPRVRRVGHTLDSAPPHSHDAHPRDAARPAAAPPHGHSHGGPGHAHGDGHEH